MALAFIAILLATCCGLAGVPVWSVPLAAVALSTISYARHHLLFRRAANLGLQDEIDFTLAGSLLNGLIASAAAYGCGAVLRFLSVGWQ
jgi:hypothetical protein